jgi:hypothetical protein
MILSGPRRGMESEQIIWESEGHSRSRTFTSEIAEFDEDLT